MQTSFEQRPLSLLYTTIFYLNFHTGKYLHSSKRFVLKYGNVNPAIQGDVVVYTGARYSFSSDLGSRVHYPQAEPTKERWTNLHGDTAAPLRSRKLIKARYKCQFALVGLFPSGRRLDSLLVRDLYADCCWFPSKFYRTRWSNQINRKRLSRNRFQISDSGNIMAIKRSLCVLTLY